VELGERITEKAIWRVASKPLGSKLLKLFTLPSLASKSSAINDGRHSWLDVVAVNRSQDPSCTYASTSHTPSDSGGLPGWTHEGSAAPSITNNGPLLVVAGAGSGKTRALTPPQSATLIGHARRRPPPATGRATSTNQGGAGDEGPTGAAPGPAHGQPVKFGQPYSTLMPQAAAAKLRNSHLPGSDQEALGSAPSNALFARLLRFDIDKYKEPRRAQLDPSVLVYDEI